MLSQLFTLKVDAALASAHMRVMSRIYGEGGLPAGHIVPRTFFDQPSHPYWDAVDHARESVRQLARYCSKHDIDPTNDPMFSGLVFKDRFTSYIESHRVVECDELTPRAIFDAYQKGNTLKANGWTLKPGMAIEDTDDYGVPCMTIPMHCTNRSGQTSKITAPKCPRELARQVMELCTGLPAHPANDDLGCDPDPYWP